MVTKKQIDDFFSANRYGFAGVSGNQKKFTHKVFKELILKDYDIIPVNPKYEDIDGFICFRTVESLPKDVTSMLIMTPKDQTMSVINDSLENDINNIWVQQGAENEEIIDFAQKSNANIITGECIMMYAEPVNSIHRVHRFFSKLTGKYIK